MPLPPGANVLRCVFVCQRSLWRASPVPLENTLMSKRDVFSGLGPSGAIRPAAIWCSDPKDVIGDVPWIVGAWGVGVCACRWAWSFCVGTGLASKSGRQEIPWSSLRCVGAGLWSAHCILLEMSTAVAMSLFSRFSSVRVENSLSMGRTLLRGVFVWVARVYNCTGVPLGGAAPWSRAPLTPSGAHLGLSPRSPCVTHVARPKLPSTCILTTRGRRTEGKHQSSHFLKHLFKSSLSYFGPTV